MIWGARKLGSREACSPYIRQALGFDPNIVKEQRHIKSNRRASQLPSPAAGCSCGAGDSLGVVDVISSREMCSTMSGSSFLLRPCACLCRMPGVTRKGRSIGMPIRTTSCSRHRGLQMAYSCSSRGPLSPVTPRIMSLR